jgi:2-polyprenyl-3-methyl-5-hydroxy-6-metoxy-1,4-benzoquinol methylase
MDFSQIPHRHLFRLPPEGILEPNGPGDPLPYYYNPIVGRLYCRRVRQALSLLNPPYESILEIGYGSGLLLPTLCAISNTVFGIDIESDPVRVAANLRNISVDATLTRGDVKDQHYPDGSFDLVVAISIFEHIDEPTPVIRRIFSLLRPGGELLVGMPQVSSFMEKAFSLIGYHNINAHHVTDYRKFLNSACDLFQLVRFVKMPRWLPKSVSLYFNMLLRKPH